MQEQQWGKAGARLLRRIRQDFEVFGTALMHRRILGAFAHA